MVRVRVYEDTVCGEGEGVTEDTVCGEGVTEDTMCGEVTENTMCGEVTENTMCGKGEGEGVTEAGSILVVPHPSSILSESILPSSSPPSCSSTTAASGVLSPSAPL